MVNPYPGKLESAADYWVCLDWYVKHIGEFCELRLMIGRGIVEREIQLSLFSWEQNKAIVLFSAPTPQACVRALHEWVLAQHP